MQSARASGRRPGPSAESRTERSTPPELPYAACFAADSEAQSRENEASCAGARPAAVYVYSKKSRYAQIARCRGRATLRRNMPHVDTESHEHSRQAHSKPRTQQARQESNQTRNEPRPAEHPLRPYRRNTATPGMSNENPGDTIRRFTQWTNNNAPYAIICINGLTYLDQSIDIPKSIY